MVLQGINGNQAKNMCRCRWSLHFFFLDQSLPFPGLTIILEGLNRMRDLSHLRAIHRGSFFLEMKTVEPRRLTGEAWGESPPGQHDDMLPAERPRDLKAARGWCGLQSAQCVSQQPWDNVFYRAPKGPQGSPRMEWSAERSKGLNAARGWCSLLSALGFPGSLKIV